jgi:hypothetical protein
MPHAEYFDDTTDATEIDGPQKRWLDSIETIPFDPSMRVSDASILGEGTPPRAVPPVRVDAAIRAQATPRPARRRTQGTPPPQPRAQTQARPIARHPHDNIPTRLNHVDVAGGHVSYSPDPDVVPYGNDTDVAPLSAIPTPPPVRLPIHAPYGAPALPPHVPTARALPPQAVMPTQIAQPLPTHVAHALPALVRPYEDGVTPYPVPPWATGQHPIPSAPIAVPPHHVHQNHLDIYADADDHAFRSSSTGPTPSLRPSLGRYLLPFMGGTALLVFVVGYFAMRGDSSTTSPAAAPVASAVAPVTVTPIAAPVVSEIVEPQLPAPSWKNREARPTIVAKTEPAAAEPAEIEMAPVATKAKVAPKKSSSSSRRAKRAEIAAIARSNAKKASKSVIELPATNTVKPAKVTIAKSAKADRDPILEEIEKPTKSAQVKTGPGKLVISSSVPTLIYIDGRSTNLMTPKTMNLSPGRHKITLLELKSRKAKTMDIDIAAGTVSKLDKKF